MVDSNSNTLRDVMKADISLGNSGVSNCWTRQVRVTRVTRMAYSPSLWLMANWLVKQNQPVSKFETKSDTNLRSLYES